ncbi:MAG: roadblock/LC7 domain-containing protein [Candidatus Methanoperedens sp.]
MNGGKMSEIYSHVLHDLREVDGVKMLALASRDGFLIAEHANDKMEILTMMSATMLRAAETATNKIEHARSNLVTVDFNGGKLITAPAGSKALVSLIATHNASLDPIIRELERTIGKVKEII